MHVGKAPNREHALKRIFKLLSVFDPENGNGINLSKGCIDMAPAEVCSQRNRLRSPHRNPRDFEVKAPNLNLFDYIDDGQVVGIRTGHQQVVSRRQIQ